MKRKFLSALMLLIFISSLFVSALSAYASEITDNETIYEKTLYNITSKSVQSTARNESSLSMDLFMPGSIEQYLEMDSPSDFAINENYIAIADENRIYLFDKNKNQGYQTYIYNSTITCLDFHVTNGTTYLYFTAKQGSSDPILYIDCSAEKFSEQSATSTGIVSCSSFIIQNGSICYASASNAVYLTEIEDDLTIVQPKPEESLFSALNTQISFAIYNNTIYFSANNSVYRIQGQNVSTWISTTSSVSISSFAILDGTCYYSTSTTTSSLYYKEGNFSETIIEENGAPITNISSVYCFGNTLYLIQRNSIRTFSKNGFQNYEITKYSDRLNRIQENASDLSVYNNQLFIADTRNGRVVKYENGVYNLVCTPSSPELVCAGENVIAIYGNSSVLSIYTYDEINNSYQLVLSENLSGILDIAYSYGSFYAISSGGKAYKITRTEEKYELISGTLSVNDPKSISADIYENLYIFSGDSNVYKMTTEQFLNGTSELNSVAVFGNAPVKQILCDYSGNIYGITNDGIYSAFSTEAKLIANIPFAELVNGAENATAVSFAFGFEENTVYILSDGFVVAADLGENAPKSLLELDAGTSYSAMHGSASADEPKSLLVKVSAGSVVLSIDGTKLTASSDYLTYTGYARTQTERIGIRIADTAGGTLVAFYEYVPAEDPEAFEGDRLYTLCLVLDEVTAAGGYTADSYSAYATNDVEIFRYPSFLIDSMLLQTGELARGQTVTVLGTISVPVDEETGGFGVDYDYCFVKVGDVYGYVPAAYLVKSANNASASTSEYSFFHVKKGESITLYSANGGSVTLEDEELVRVYGEPDKDNLVRVTYTDDLGTTYEGRVDADLLYRADGSVLVVLAVVCLVTAAVLFSGCYLILRRQPTVV